MVKVSLVKCKDYDFDKVYSAIKESISLIGGLNIKEGSKVLVKPNLLRPRHPKFAVSTHPIVVKAVIRILKENKCDVIVGDSPGFHDPFVTAKTCGLLDICKEEGVEFVNFNNKKSYFYKDAKFMHRFDLTDVLDNVDCIVNLPKLKTHMMMGVTFAVKNTFGFMVGMNKSKMHMKLADKRKFAEMLVDLNEFVKPCLNIIDGIVGMEGEGPGNGDTINVGIVSASYDSLAMDIIMCYLTSFDPLSIWTNKVGLERRDNDYFDKIEQVGCKLDDVKVKFKHAKEFSITFAMPKAVSKFINNLVTPARPIIIPKKCVFCKECIKICPANTIGSEEFDGKKVAFIHKEKCIRCFCCHEICKFGAIDIKKSMLSKMLEKLGFGG